MEEKKLNKYFYALGRRKTSVATIRLFEGKGDNTINGLSIKKLYPSKTDNEIILEPVKVLDILNNVYFTAKVSGGGKSSQKEAIRHALSRALVKYDETFKSVLKPKGFLTRDPRMVERKHTGFRKARKSEQYSKR
jgi:small subunit ribosomal protein S9